MLFYPCPLGFRNLEEEITDIMEVVRCVNIAALFCLYTLVFTILGEISRIYLTRQKRKYHCVVLSLYAGFYITGRDR